MSKRYCIGCGTPYGSPHEETCQRYTPPNEIDTLRTENEELKEDLSDLSAVYESMKERLDGKVATLEYAEKDYTQRLDDAGVPNADDGGNVYSLLGRIRHLISTNEAAEAKNAKLVEALEYIAMDKMDLYGMDRRRIAEQALKENKNNVS